MDNMQDDMHRLTDPGPQSSSDLPGARIIKTVRSATDLGEFDNELYRPHHRRNRRRPRRPAVPAAVAAVFTVSTDPPH